MRSVASLVTGVALLLSAHGQAGEIQLVSRAHPAIPSETPAGRTWLPDFFGRITSRDGRFVAFLSFAANLIPGGEDTNESADLFLHDRETQTTILVSHAAGFPLRAAAPTGFPPTSVSVSADGRFVAYSSDAPNLVAGPTLAGTHVFLFDRVTSTTSLVSDPIAPPTGLTMTSSAVALSDDGRYLAFQSNAKFIPGQDGVPTLFLFDRLSRTNVLVSHPVGSPTTGVAVAANAGCLSGDGQRLVFTSSAPNLVPNQSGTGNQVFVYDVPNDRLTLVSHGLDSLSIGGNGASQDGRISDDGTHISFSSTASNLIQGFTPGEPGRGSYNVYLYSIASGSIRLVSHAMSSPQVGGEWGSEGAELSHDGGIVTFLSSATNLAGWPGGNAYAWDRATGLVSLVSRSPSGQAGGATSIALSSDGSRALFASHGLLVPGQVNPDPSPFLSYFLMDLRSGQIRLAAHAASSPLMSRPVRRAALSGDGLTVALESPAIDLVDVGDINTREDIFAYDVPTGTFSLISRVARPGRTPMGGSAAAGEPIRSLMSQDGRYVLFSSDALNLVPGQTGLIGQFGRSSDLFQADRFSGEIRMVTHAVGHSSRGMDAKAGTVGSSADGRYVVYASAALLAAGATTGHSTHCYIWDRTTGANGLVADDCSNEGVALTPDGRFLAYSSGQQIFLLNRATGIHQLVSRRSGTSGISGNGSSYAPTISHDGRWVAFSSTATDLVSPDTAGTQVFIFDAFGGTNTLVSQSASAPQGGNAVSYKAALAADGSSVAYVSSATDLVSGQVDQPGTDDVFLYDRATRSTRLVSHSAGSLATATGTSLFDIARPAVNENGRFVGFSSNGDNLVPGQSDTPLPSRDVFLYDRITEGNLLLSHSWVSETSCVGGHGVDGLSADGSKVLFTSSAVDVVQGQVNRGPANAFLADLATGGVNLLSGIGGSQVVSGNGSSAGNGLTPDGSVALLWSNASDLVPDDFNGSGDVFVHVNAVPPPAGSRAFHTVLPCRLADTRLTPGEWGGPAVGAGFDRSFVALGRCGVPATAVGVSLNLTVTGPTAPGNLRLFAGGAAPPASVINFSPGQTRANSAVAYLGRNGELTIRNDQPYGQVHVILDLNGYLE